MQLGQVIRKYRKSKNMTQEEMADRLGVTAPAVNKWEKGHSLPDITLLAPIARLLGISLDTLLSFQEELTQAEIEDFIYTLNNMLREQPYEEAFTWAKEKVEQYPNCELLVLEAAILLNVERMKQNIDGQNREGSQEGECGANGRYEGYIIQWLTRALGNREEQIRTMAADSMFNLYMNKGQYGKAEECLAYFSAQNPERKRKQAVIYDRTGRREDAYRTYEEVLFSLYQMADLVFHSIYMLAMQDEDMKKARAMLEKQSALAGIFEMGEYHELADRLMLSIAEKDAEMAILTLRRMLVNFGSIHGFVKAPLYGHMAFREAREEFLEQSREDLVNAFRDDETCGFLKGDSRWQEILEEYGKKQ